MRFQHVHVVVNPAAGNDEPVLSILNSVFGEAGIRWEVSITKGAGDAAQQARAAVASGADVVAAYGGDGTVAEVASGLLGTGVPLAILPGGTANAMASELNIPAQLRQACELICSDAVAIRKVDMGELDTGDEQGRRFVLRVGVGFEAAMVEKADRGLKDRFGNFAYLWSAVTNLVQPEIARYKLVIDGVPVETEGLTCIIANSGNLAQRNLSLIPGIDISDGVLDVIVIQPAGMRMFVDLLGSITGLMNVQAQNGAGQDGAGQAGAVQSSADQSGPGQDGTGQNNGSIGTGGDQARRTVQWWQAKEVHLESEPPQTVQLDGEVLGRQAITCRVLPQAIRVVTPGVAPSQPVDELTSAAEPAAAVAEQ